MHLLRFPHSSLYLPCLRPQHEDFLLNESTRTSPNPILEPRSRVPSGLPSTQSESKDVAEVTSRIDRLSNRFYLQGDRLRGARHEIPPPRPSLFAACYCHQACHRLWEVGFCGSSGVKTRWEIDCRASYCRACSYWKVMTGFRVFAIDLIREMGTWGSQRKNTVSTCEDIRFSSMLLYEYRFKGLQIGFELDSKPTGYREAVESATKIKMNLCIPLALVFKSVGVVSVQPPKACDQDSSIAYHVHASLVHRTLP
uniref:BTB/POZ domain-containing protein n=1 Tax=Steinernema glaseri TaxID=37863 RepID=A0A1I7YS47_9BILA